jgi:general L-amino acid transport system substrate-binding protein
MENLAYWGPGLMPNLVTVTKYGETQMKRLGLGVAALLLASLAFGGTLDDIKKRGHLKCGVNPNLPGFSFVDARGERQGFDVDFCKALAAAIGVEAKFSPATAKDRFTQLQSGEVDVLYRNTTITSSRETKMGLDYAGVNYYDGQGFMVRKSLGVKNAKGLAGATVCVETGTTTEKNLADWFRSNKLQFKALTFEGNDPTRLAYEAGRCDAYTTDASGLAATRLIMKNPDEHVLLPDIISKEPLGPMTRHGDNNWTDVVRWVFNASLIAEEKGITKANVDQMKNSDDPEVKRMLGTTETVGPDMGLPQDWAVRAIKAQGNYGEIFDRNIGPKTPLRLDRGLNALWSTGGLQYAMPVR